MRDFWLSCGHHLLDRDSGGGLLVSDAMLKVYLARPELAPPPEACVVERTLYSTLLDEPRRAIATEEIAAIADADARENWGLMIAFRDQLLRHPTLEATYLSIVRNGLTGTPQLFINQLVHVILRNILDDCDDPFVLRAAEMFFRPQLVTLHNGSLIAADEETIAGHGGKQVSPLVSMMGLPAMAGIDILGDNNAQSYWERSDLFDTAIDLTAGRKGLTALGEVIARWIKHLLSVDVRIESLVEVRDVNLVWYVGLDTEGTKIGDALWNGVTIDDQSRGRVIGLYRLTFRDPRVVLDKVADEPIYLILAMTADKVIRLKPQNLVTGLPIRHLEVVS